MSMPMGSKVILSSFNRAIFTELYMFSRSLAASATWEEERGTTCSTAALYRAAVEQVVPLSSSQVAEAAKLLENISRSVNIALVNELKITFEPMGLDLFAVIGA